MTKGISCCLARAFLPPEVFLVARAESLEQLNEILADEPFCKAGLMRFSEVIEFNPVQYQPILNEWFGKS